MLCFTSSCRCLGDLFGSQSPAEIALRSLVSLVDPRIIEVSELYVGMEGSTQVSPYCGVRLGAQPRPEAAGDLPAVEEVGWRLPAPARAVEVGVFVIEALVVVGEVSVLGPRS